MAYMTKADELDFASFKAVAAYYKTDDERITAPIKKALIDLGCDHFIETEIFLPEKNKFLVRLDGYKKHN